MGEHGSMRARQRGITFLGWLVLLGPLAIVFYSGIRLAPIYLNYMKVTTSLEQAAHTLQSDQVLTPQSIQNALARQFDIESLDYPKLSDIVVKRIDGQWTMEANYEDVAPLFAGLSLLVKFDKVVPIGS